MKVRGIVVTAAALLALPVAAQQPTERDIVVTAIPLHRSEALLKACLTRACSPKEDIDATLAHAENAFVAGDYEGARKTLRASIKRNRRYAQTIPVAVSDLMRAQSRVSAHLGELESYLSGMVDVKNTLAAGLPEGNPRILEARIAIGDSQAATGDFRTAVGIYRSEIAQARQYGAPRLAGYAQLRIANLYSALAERNPAYRQAAKRELKALTALTDPQLSVFTSAAKVIKAGAAARRGDMAAIDSVAQTLQVSNETSPVLLYAPPIAQDFRVQRNRGETSTTADRMLTTNVNEQWVDIGLWIEPNGKVRDVEILRESPKLSGNWVAPITAALAERRYAPFTPKSPNVANQRIERYSLTAPWTSRLGTRVRVRAPSTRVEMLDLTRDDSAT